MNVAICIRTHTVPFPLQTFYISASDPGMSSFFSVDVIILECCYYGERYSFLRLKTLQGFTTSPPAFPLLPSI